ncbi:3-oxoacyl-ACP synthase III [Actinomycetospora corticicola]|uniref:3-oxoacyl-[acyl-carrier-protein] synthase-3 n=1 Tax=Actinomycetospora corticicola TaxID=663602 RepID=A0A7Y9E0L5_9PSEU|nr:3-oxoacyl-ACP synthase III [Actinomycetospora corticicola]NYD38720.1 3-oxoacyl-[acyl-carrier-protein] synthase-3 [Actinomycetospora corticicola]
MRAAQRYDDVVITGLAHVDAPHVVTSTDLEDRLAGTLAKLRITPGLLEKLSGIAERRVWDDGTMPSEVAARAGEKALADSGVRRDDIGVLINTSVSRDHLEPSTASIVHGRMELSPEAGNFDLGNACLGFLNGMNVVSTMIEAGEIDHGLVVAGETSRFAMESTIARLAGDDATRKMFHQQFATLTVGSGAVAMVLSRGTQGHRYLGGLGRASTMGNSELCVGQADEMRTDSSGLLSAGMELAGRAWKDAVSAFDWDTDSYDVYCLHQVSKVHTRAVADQLGLDIARFPSQFPRFGNIGPAGVPTVLSKAVEDGTVTDGSRVMLMGVGSGINAAAAEVVW